MCFQFLYIREYFAENINRSVWLVGRSIGCERQTPAFKIRTVQWCDDHGRDHIIHISYSHKRHVRVQPQFIFGMDSVSEFSQDSENQWKLNAIKEK